MLLTVIAASTIGVIVGININNILIKRNGSELQILEEIVTIYEANETELKEKVNYYKSGMNEILKQNIDLQRRLNNGNSRRI